LNWSSKLGATGNFFGVRRPLPAELGLNQIGSIAVSKQADLMIVKGNPAAKITEVENVEIVFKDGVGYDSEKFRACRVGWGYGDHGVAVKESSRGKCEARHPRTTYLFRKPAKRATDTEPRPVGSGIGIQSAKIVRFDRSRFPSGVILQVASLTTISRTPRRIVGRIAASP